MYKLTVFTIGGRHTYTKKARDETNLVVKVGVWVPAIYGAKEVDDDAGGGNDCLKDQTMGPVVL